MPEHILSSDLFAVPEDSSPPFTPSSEFSTFSEIASQVTQEEPDLPVLDSIFNLEIVTFQVENVHFQVLKSGFNVPGTIFEKKFTAMKDSSGNKFRVEGSSVNCPIKIYNVRANEFKIFLRVLYPFIAHTPVSSETEWMVVIKLATRWGYTEMRKGAIEAISPSVAKKTPLEKITLAREYKVISWCKEGYLSLCQQQDLSLDQLLGQGCTVGHNKSEKTSVGPVELAKIYSIREKHMSDLLKLMQLDRYRSSWYCEDQCRLDYGPSFNSFGCRCSFQSSIDSVLAPELLDAEYNGPVENYSTFTKSGD